MLSSSQTAVDNVSVVNARRPSATCKASYLKKDDNVNPGGLPEKTSHTSQSQRDDEAPALSHRRVRNAQQPVAQLPPEILTEIFAKCLSDIIDPPDQRSFRNYDINTYYAALYRLMAVCKTWANVIEETPLLWSYISAFCNPNLVPKILLKSSQRPLSVWYSHVTRFDRLDTTSFADLVIKHFRRWRTVEFSFSSAKDVCKFRQILESNDSQIESLALRGYINDPQGPSPLHILGGKSEYLQKLSVDSIPLSWDFKFARLRKLHLASLGPESAPKFGHLVTILQQCKELTDIAFDRIDCVVDTVYKEPFLILNNVVHFFLFRLSRRTAGALLQSIKAMPSCNSLSIIFSHMMSTVPNVLPRYLGHLVLDLQRILLSAPAKQVDQNLEVIFEDGVAFSHPSGLLIDMPGLEDSEEVVSAIQWFGTSVLHPVKIIPTTIDLHPDISNWQEEEVLSSLDGFHVVKLYASSIPDPGFLFECLCTPISTKGESARWLFPYLKEIYITQYEGEQYEWAVLQAVKGRYGLLWTQQQFPDLRLPSRFKLGVAGRPLASSMIAELSGILGAESLILKPDSDYSQYGAEYHDTEDNDDGSEESWEDEDDTDEDEDEDEDDSEDESGGGGDQDEDEEDELDEDQ